jgi:hypothetical protein
MLARQVCSYDVGGRNFLIQQKPMHEDFEFSRASTDKSAKLTTLVGLVDPLMDASQLAKLTGLVGLADFPCAVADSPVVDPANLPKKFSNRPSGTSSDVGVNLCDWRTPFLAYLFDPSVKVDKSVRRSAFKYVLHNDELY